MPAPPTPLQQLLVRRDEVECPLLVAEPTVDQRAELGEALLNVSAMIEAAETTPVEVATMCLHCRKLPASKVEGEAGFTLCDACYHQAGVEIAPVAAVLAEMQLSEAKQLAAELERWKHCFRKAARDLLYHGPLRDLPSEQFDALGPGDLMREANAAVIRLEAVCDEASELRYLCSSMGVKVTADGKPRPLVDLLHHILTSDVDYGNRYSLLRRANERDARAAEYEEGLAELRKEAAEFRRWARGETS